MLGNKITFSVKSKPIVWTNLAPLMLVGPLEKIDKQLKKYLLTRRNLRGNDIMTGCILDLMSIRAPAYMVDHISNETLMRLISLSLFKNFFFNFYQILPKDKTGMKLKNS